MLNKKFDIPIGWGLPVGSDGGVGTSSGKAITPALYSSLGNGALYASSSAGEGIRPDGLALRPRRSPIAFPFIRDSLQKVFHL